MVCMIHLPTLVLFPYFRLKGSILFILFSFFSRSTCLLALLITQLHFSCCLFHLAVYFGIHWLPLLPHAVSTLSAYVLRVNLTYPLADSLADSVRVHVSQMGIGGFISGGLILQPNTATQYWLPGPIFWREPL